MRLFQNSYPVARLAYFCVNIVKSPNGVIEGRILGIYLGDCVQLAVCLRDGDIDIRVYLRRGGFPIR